MYINFSDIPGHHNLFLDYLYEFENVKIEEKHTFTKEIDANKLWKKVIPMKH